MDRTHAENVRDRYETVRTRYPEAAETLPPWKELTTEFRRALMDLVPEEQPLPPVEVMLYCPRCGTKHVDVGEYATKPHKSHTCQNKTCGLTWKASHHPTVGVAFLAGTENE